MVFTLWSGQNVPTPRRSESWVGFRQQSHKGADWKVQRHSSAPSRSHVWNHQTHSSDWGWSVSSDYLFSLMPSACPVFSSLITLFLTSCPCVLPALPQLVQPLTRDCHIKPNYVDAAQGSLSVYPYKAFSLCINIQKVLKFWVFLFIVITYPQNPKTSHNLRFYYKNKITDKSQEEEEQIKLPFKKKKCIEIFSDL